MPKLSDSLDIKVIEQEQLEQKEFTENVIRKLKCGSRKIKGIHSCGHKGVVEVYGNKKERMEEATKEFSKPCSGCYYVKIDEMFAEEDMLNSQNFERATIMGMPKLIARFPEDMDPAEKARTKFLRDSFDFIDSNKDIPSDQLAKFEEAFKNIISCDSAYFWERFPKAYSTILHLCGQYDDFRETFIDLVSSRTIK